MQARNSQAGAKMTAAIRHEGLLAVRHAPAHPPAWGGNTGHFSLRELAVGPSLCLPDQEERPTFNVELSVSDIDGHAVVALCGELDLSGAPDVAAHLIAAVAAFGPSVIVDLAGLTSIDSCGLETLMRVLRWTRQSGGDLPLAAPQHQVWRVLEITGLIDVFTVYPSMTLAISDAPDPPLSAPAM